MSRIAVLVLITLLAPLSGASIARARPVLGIDDESVAMLNDARFRALGVRYMRIVVPYDVATDRVQLARYAPVFDLARARNVQVFAAFNHGVRRPRHLPSVGEYARAVRAFHRRFPEVRDIGAWNEANHKSQPTQHNPRMAAAYFNALRAICAGCRIVAADVLDQPGFERWVTTFRRYARSPRIWGLHNYGDVNNNRDRSIPALRRVTGGRGKVWLTETGGIVRFAHTRPYDERRAARATRHVLGVAAGRRVARIYLYQWSGAPLGSRWDSGLIAYGGRPRPALNVVEAYLHRPLTRLPPIPRLPPFPKAPRRR